MHSIDFKEKQMLSEWAKCHAEDDFPCVMDEDTYFRERDEEDDTYLMEYDFSTIADLKLLMEKASRGNIPSEVRHMLAVAAFREKPEIKQKAELEQTQNIPEFIYVF